MAQDTEKQAPAEPSGLASTLDRTFGLTAAGSSVPTELRAGLATFLTMAYIMFVNPAILERAGMDEGAVFVATCLAAALGSLIMGLYANYPIALAPGMGLNAYFAFTMVPELGGNWQLALGCVFVSGVLFFALSLSPLRAWLIDAIPLSLKLGIAAGIGFFLALIALENAGIVADDRATLVTLGDLGEPKAWLAACGFLLIAGLSLRKIPGAIILGVLAVTVAAVALGLEPWRGIAEPPPPLAPTFLQMDVAGVFQLGLVTIVLTLLLVTILDTAGTLIGVARQAGLLDRGGRLPRLRQALLADSASAALGAALGTSTNTAYIESAAGVEEGGRTGLTAVVVAVLFLLSLFLAPLAQNRTALRHGAGAPLRRMPDGGKSRRLRLGRSDRLYPRAHHRADDAAQLFHRNRHRARLHRLCGAQSARRTLRGDQRRRRGHRLGVLAEADLHLIAPSPPHEILNPA
jgi:AGZA family xanthine/uracil permease-like MFS transporter